MIDLKKAKLPESVEVCGERFKVQTSFKYWLRFLELLAVKGTEYTNFDFMYQQERPPDRVQGFIALLQFCNPPSELPRADGGDRSGEKAIDYAVDSDYIYAAFMEMYGIDLVESEMHWYKFQSLLRGLHGTKLNEIIGYRLWENTSGRRDGYTRSMERLRRAWELPQESAGDDDELREFQRRLRGG